MQKVLVSLPDSLAARMKAIIPPRHRSGVLATLIENELTRREAQLYQCAVEVDKDQALNAERDVWTTTVGDGIDVEAW